MTHYEETLERDIQRICDKVTEMGTLAVSAIQRCLQALDEKNRQIAYSVILRDQHIDELEKEIDRLCLEFIVRQQPVARTLRFAYATIKVSSELERVGDYAESMARHILDLASIDVVLPKADFAEIAERATTMLSDAVRAFVTQDDQIARRTMEADGQVNRLRHDIAKHLLSLQQNGALPIKALLPFMTLVNRFERIADQAKSISQEALYIRTGEYVKHPGTEAVRLLFVDQDNACLSQMAEAIGHSLRQPRFVFTSAGLTRSGIDPGTLSYLESKGLDVSRATAKAVAQVPHLEHYQVIIGLHPDARQVFPPPPTKSVCLEWALSDPRAVTGGAEKAREAFDEAFDYLHRQITDLASAILGDKARC